MWKADEERQSTDDRFMKQDGHNPASLTQCINRRRKESASVSTPALAFTGRASNPLDHCERFQITWSSPFPVLLTLHSCPCTHAIDLQPQDHPRLSRQVTRLLDDNNNATARPAFRDIAQARLVAFACHEEIAGRCFSPACAPARVAGRSVAEHRKPSDRKSHTRDWPWRPRSGRSPSPGSRSPCE
jgi:hypothetical protein